MRLPGWGWRVWAGIGGVVAAGVAVMAAWWGAAVLHALVPMSRPGWDKLNAETRAQAEGQFRLALIQGLAALGAGFALFYTARNFRLNRRGQVTERFTNALERLGSDLPYVRSGGVFALEQIVQDAPEQTDHIVRILVAFLRDRVPAAGAEGAPGHPDPDVQTALTTLVLLEPTRSLVNLSRIHLHGAGLVNGNLRRADLTGTNLAAAYMRGADLRGAHLYGANLTGANLSSANLTGANLRHADLRGAHLTGADLSHVNLRGAHLTGADLSHVNLHGADLTDADLSRVRLRHADVIVAVLSDAQLDCADLTGANLTHANLRGARLTRANLTRVNLSGADLRIADLTSADLTGTNLTGTNLSSTNLTGATRAT
ncbi:pentapeptide repeat-containing protein [Embleya sp. NPDC056575]|uniref:pentapeptide repeat-containing protein n=1 Tax=unclassified Embleya TaxID=2699296 RepID=UPI0036AC038A